MKKCSKCKKVKNRDQFPIGRKGLKNPYVFSYCRSCRKQQCYLNLNKDINKYLLDKYNRLKIRANKFNIKFKLSKEYFIELYKEQKGKCFYTDIELICKVGEGWNMDSLSTDKIIPEKGYIENNIVFCTQKANTVKCNLTMEELKRWIPKWYNRVIKRKIK